MKTKIFTLLIVFPMLIFAQDWAPVGAKWTYDHEPGVGKYITTIESVKDTMVMGKLCRLLLSKETDESMRPDGTYFWRTFILSKDFIYSSRDTVFHYNPFEHSFYPLYRMNVQKKDTVVVLERATPCGDSPYFCSQFEYVVDSISSLTLQGQALKLIYNSETEISTWVFNLSKMWEHYPILEKVGSLKYFFGVSKYRVMEGEISCLRCYDDGQISYRAPGWTKACDYLRPLQGSNSVRDKLDNQVIVSPNPFDAYFRINISDPIEYELYDSFGRLWMQGKEKEVNTNLLPKGIYILKLTIDQKETETIKLIK